MKRTEIIVVDDFLDDPDAVRQLALRQDFIKMHCAGLRTKQQFRDVAPYREEFERILDRRLTHWDDNDANGRFQVCFESDAIPYHIDGQSMAGILFLTPNAPIEAGLSIFRGKQTGLRRRTEDRDLMDRTFGGGAEFDRNRWEEVDRIGNFYNRLVLFDAQVPHGASAYFGTTPENGRLFQNFFFNYLGDDSV